MSYLINKDTIGYERVWCPDRTWDTPSYTREDLNSQDVKKQQAVQGWLAGLAEPWSDTAVSFLVHPSNKTGVIPEDERWVCDYASFVYDGIEAHVCAYAATPHEAFERCHNLLNELIENYYIELDDEDEPNRKEEET